MNPRMGHDFDTVVVGAGISGLISAVQNLDDGKSLCMVERYSASSQTSAYTSAPSRRSHGTIYIDETDLAQLNALLGRYGKPELSVLPLTQTPLYYWDEPRQRTVHLFNLRTRRENPLGHDILKCWQQMSRTDDKNEKCRYRDAFFKRTAKTASVIDLTRFFLNQFFIVSDLYHMPIALFQDGLEMILGKKCVFAFDPEASGLITSLESILSEHNCSFWFDTVVESATIGNDHRICALETNRGDLGLKNCIIAGPLANVYSVIAKKHLDAKVIHAIDRVAPVSAVAANTIVQFETKKHLPSCLQETNCATVIFPKLNLHVRLDLRDHELALSCYSFFFDTLSGQKKQVGRVLKSIDKAMAKLFAGSVLPTFHKARIVANPHVFSRSYETAMQRHYLRSHQSKAIANLRMVSDGVGEDNLWSFNLFKSAFLCTPTRKTNK